MRLCVLYGIVLLCFKLNAQGISNVDFKANVFKLNITFDYIKFDDIDYDVDVYLISENNIILKAINLKGNFKNIKQGKCLKIIWDLKKQQNSLPNDKYKIQLNLIEAKKFGPNAALYSLIMPGIGTYKVTNGRVWKSRTIPFLTAVCISSLSYIYSNYYYNNYKKSEDLNLYSNYYKKANTFNKIGLISVSFATSIYFYDLIWVIKKGIYNKHVLQSY